MEIEFTKKTIKLVEKKLRIALKVGNPGQTQKVCAILMLAYQIAPESVCRLFEITLRTLYNWRNEFVYEGIKCFRIVKRKGRHAKLTDKQKQELKRIILDGPQKAGFAHGLWKSSMIKELIEKKYKVSYNRRYIPDLLNQIGLSYQKAKFESDKNNDKLKQLWRDETWPCVLLRAKKENAAILFEDEASFAMWGSLGYTWGLKGQQPVVKTSGKRKNLKVFGAIDYFSGRFVFQTVEGKLNSISYICFLKKVLKRFPGKVIIIHDGAPYHRSKDTREFIQAQNHLEDIPLPAYTPEYNIIEYFWKNVKQRTHNKYFADFSSLKKCVRNALRYFQRHLSEVLNLCSSYQNMLAHGLPKTL